MPIDWRFSGIYRHDITRSQLQQPLPNGRRGGEGEQVMIQQADNGLYVIVHETTQMALVLTKQELPNFLEWLTANLMDGLDADDFWSMNDGMKED